MRISKPSSVLRRCKSAVFNLRHAFDSPLTSLVSHMHRREVECVLDIGANRGQFALDLRDLGYEGNILSFEPQKSSFSELRMNAISDPNWQVFNFGFGPVAGEFKMHVGSNGGKSSSLLEAEKHHNYFPNVDFSLQEKVRINTLSEFIQSRALNLEKTLLKLDTQGLEYDILRSCNGYLEKIALIFCETSIVPLYQKEVSVNEIVIYLLENNHNLIDFSNGLRSTDGRLVQIDLLTTNQTYVI